MFAVNICENFLDYFAINVIKIKNLLSKNLYMTNDMNRVKKIGVSYHPPDQGRGQIQGRIYLFSKRTREKVGGGVVSELGRPVNCA